MQTPETSYHSYAGVLTIISSILIFIYALAFVFLTLPFYPHQASLIIQLLLSTGLMLAFAIVGLAGGITSLLRRHFVFAVIAGSIILVESITIVETFIAQLFLVQTISQIFNLPYVVFPILAFPALILSILALIFITRSKTEFLESP